MACMVLAVITLSLTMFSKNTPEACTKQGIYVLLTKAVAVGVECIIFQPITRVKSGNFGHQVNSDSDLVCFIFQLLE